MKGIVNYITRLVYLKNGVFCFYISYLQKITLSLFSILAFFHFLNQNKLFKGLLHNVLSNKDNLSVYFFTIYIQNRILYKNRFEIYFLLGN